MVADDRGQLLLAGSIIIALLFIGLAVLLNSVVFTENVAGGSSVEVTGDVNEFNREARRNARSLTIRVNHAGNYSSINEIESNLAANFTNYSRRLGESYADTGSVFVNMSYETTTDEGRRVVQTDDGTFENGVGDWNALDGVSDRHLGWFVLNLNASAVSETTESRIRFVNTTGDSYVLTVKRSDTGRLLVNSTMDGSHTSNVSCTPTGGRLVMNVIDGTSSTSSCEVNGSQVLGGPYNELWFENPGAVSGKYEFVVDDTISPIVPGCSLTSNPCKMPAAWEIRITTAYHTGTVTYENTQEIVVYEPT